MEFLDSVLEIVKYGLVTDPSVSNGEFSCFFRVERSDLKVFLSARRFEDIMYRSSDFPTSCADLEFVFDMDGKRCFSTVVTGDWVSIHVAVLVDVAYAIGYNDTISTIVVSDHPILSQTATAVITSVAGTGGYEAELVGPGERSFVGRVESHSVWVVESTR